MDPDLLNMTVAGWLADLMPLVFLLFLLYTRSAKKRVPVFTKEKYPFIGSYRFFTHKC
jgi:hypothetical protein